METPHSKHGGALADIMVKCFVNHNNLSEERIILNEDNSYHSDRIL